MPHDFIDAETRCKLIDQFLLFGGQLIENNFRQNPGYGLRFGRAPAAALDDGVNRERGFLVVNENVGADIFDYLHRLPLKTLPDVPLIPVGVRFRVVQGLFLEEAYRQFLPDILPVFPVQVIPPGKTIGHNADQHVFEVIEFGVADCCVHDFASFPGSRFHVPKICFRLYSVTYRKKIESVEKIKKIFSGPISRSVPGAF